MPETKSAAAPADPILIFTDGSALSNPGPGGYGVIIRDGTSEREASRSYRHTTNNRMEIMAVLHGLTTIASLDRKRPAIVYSDSQYVVGAISKDRLSKWSARGWTHTRRRLPLKNADLWRELMRLRKGRRVKARWVRAHSGHPENERCDDLAQAAARYGGSDRAIDAEYERQNPPNAEKRNLVRTLNAKSPPAVPKLPIYRPSPTPLGVRGTAHRVAVSGEHATDRRATASCRVAMSASTVGKVRDGKLAKGDLLATARAAGIDAAKRNWELNPLRGHTPLSFVEVALDLAADDDDDALGVTVTATARARAETGVEMEALTAASVAALSVYDSCRRAERDIAIQDLRLVRDREGWAAE